MFYLKSNAKVIKTFSKIFNAIYLFVYSFIKNIQRMFTQIKKIKYFLLPYSILFFGGLLTLFLYKKSDIFLFINSKNNQFLDVLFSKVTHIGDGWSFGIFLIVAFFYVKRKDFYFGVAIFASTSLISTLFKRVFFSNELRPFAWFVNNKVVHFVEGVTVYSNNSFPSGHTITAFSLAFYAAYLIKNGKLDFVFLLIAVLVGYSRIYLGQHFFGDVVFGSLISVSTSLLCLYVFDRFVFDKETVDL